MVMVSVVPVVALASLVVVLNGCVVVEVLVVDVVVVAVLPVAFTGDIFVLVIELVMVVSVASAGVAVFD